MIYRNLSAVLLVCSVLLISFSMDQSDVHPFEAYLAEPHPAYSYELQSTIEGDSYKAYVIRMVSQEWLSEEIVNEPEWWHWLTVVVPDEVEHTTGMLWIGGGTNYNDIPGTVNPIVLDAALATNSITAFLHNVPFQPISFHGDRLEQRYEDDLIAYGWRKFMEGGAIDEDAFWLSRLPMTAAAARAMDTVTDFTLENLNLEVNDYLISGASKRGWTTWTTGIFDSRVVAIAPVVIDLLNILPSFEHHWQAYGEWSPAISEYEDERIMDWQYSEEYDRLRELVDPYSYLDRLDMPKYIINAASDEFFLPDSWQFYWHDLPGDKYLRYVPNAGHSLSGTDAPESLIAFYNHILNDNKLPKFEWEASENGFRIQLDPYDLPDDLLLWSAHNQNGREFRLYVIDRIWLAQGLDVPEEEELFVDINTPNSGFTAWFVEAVYNSDSSIPLKQTTGVVVTPDEYPFEPFRSENPMGTFQESTE
ncbi:PhoPQ-activated protein PqaA family protein [soil metagenome]